MEGVGGNDLTMKFELIVDFLTMHLPTKFHQTMFNRSKVIILTNKKTNPQTKRFCQKDPPCSAMPCQWKINQKRTINHRNIMHA